jgi:hypothetical protein
VFSLRKNAAWWGCVLALSLWAGDSYALLIQLNDVGTAPMNAIQLGGFQRAATFWESKFDDDVTLRLDVSFDALDPGVLGGTFTPRFEQSYANVKTAIIADATTHEDFIGVNYLPDGPLAFRTVARRSFKPVFDNNNTHNNNFIELSRANAKALGLTTTLNSNPNILGPHDTTNPDADIIFSTNFSFDFEPDDGIDANHFDFIGVAVHEIGHALGFISGVDKLNGFNFDNIAVLSALDLYRYSTESLAIPDSDGLDILLGGEPYFSIDGGATNLGLFSTGRGRVGDQSQASHWKDDLELGIMDPTFAPTEIGYVTDLDLLSFDMMGWDLAPLVPPGLLGDLDMDGDVDGDDVQLMSIGINTGVTDTDYDLNDSGVVDAVDGVLLVEDIIGTNIADFDLDFTVGVPDLIIWAKNFGTGDTFGQGDSDFDGVVGVPDLITWAKNFGVTSSVSFGGGDAGSTQAMQFATAIPEPASAWLCLSGLAVLCSTRRQKRKR